MSLCFLRGINKMNLSKRNYSIELLRILVTIGVIVLHLNSSYIGGVMHSAYKGSLNSFISYFTEGVFICSVNVFLLITGYFSVNKTNTNVVKVIKLICECICISFAIYLVRIFFMGETISIKSVVLCILPVNYYVVLWTVIMLFLPFINYFILMLEIKNKFSIFLVLYISILMFFPFFVNILEITFNKSLSGLSTIGLGGDSGGYTIVNFLGVYLIGAYLSLHPLNKNYKKYLLLFVILSSSVSIWQYISDLFGFRCPAFQYNNPLVIASSVLLFSTFMSIDIKDENPIIKVLSKISFTVYLIQGIAMRFLNVVKYSNSSTFVLIMHSCLSIMIIFTISIPISYIYDYIWKIVSKSFAKSINDSYNDLVVIDR